MADEKIKQKIAALLAKANTTEHKGEASAFMAKALEMMEKHQVELHELGTEDPIGKTYGVTAQSGPPAYKSKVQAALAKLYGCKTVRELDGRVWRLALIGCESARITTELMTAYVWEQVYERAAILMNAKGIKKDIAVRDIARELELRIYEEVHKRDVQVKRDGRPAAGSFSLMVVDGVESWITNHYDDLRKAKRHGNKKSSADAREHAKEINLNRQVTGSSALRLN